MKEVVEIYEHEYKRFYRASGTGKPYPKTWDSLRRRVRQLGLVGGKELTPLGVSFYRYLNQSLDQCSRCYAYQGPVDSLVGGLYTLSHISNSYYDLLDWAQQGMYEELENCAEGEYIKPPVIFWKGSRGKYSGPILPTFCLHDLYQTLHAAGGKHSRLLPLHNRSEKPCFRIDIWPNCGYGDFNNLFSKGYEGLREEVTEFRDVASAFIYMFPVMLGVYGVIKHLEATCKDNSQLRYGLFQELVGPWEDCAVLYPLANYLLNSDQLYDIPDSAFVKVMEWLKENAEAFRDAFHVKAANLLRDRGYTVVDGSIVLNQGEKVNKELYDNAVKALLEEETKVSECGKPNYMSFKPYKELLNTCQELTLKEFMKAVEDLKEEDEEQD